VLFLADKLAALEVVKDRLDAAGLGDFCLELHSDKAHPKPIIESLRRRYDLTQHAGPEPKWREELQRLRGARGHVRNYLSALHAADDDDEHTPFDLMWSAIAARRELGKELEAIRRINLEGVFNKGWHELDRCKDALKLYAHAVHDYSQRHGSFASAAWSKVGMAAITEHDPDLVADVIRDAYQSAEALSGALGTTSSTICLDLPRSPGAIRTWVDTIRQLPAIVEDYLLPQLGTFSSIEIEAAASLAVQRMELVVNPNAEIASDRLESIADLAEQVQQTAITELSPAEIVARAARMGIYRESLSESLDFFSRLIAAFRPPSPPNIETAANIARIVKFARTVPHRLDPYLWFDRTETEAVLSEGATRLVNLSDWDRTLRARFRMPAETKWPPLDELRIVAEVCSAKWLHRLGNSLTGKRRRAMRIVEEMGSSELTPSDVNEAIALVEEQHAFAADPSLSAAAATAWSGLSTPFEELVAVLRLRRRFHAEINRSNDFVNRVYQALFSSNPKFIDALRQYGHWSDHLLTALQEWPESLENTPLNEAAERISARVETFATLAAQIQQRGIAALTISFSQILKRSGVSKR
jgi:hypothetical protein